jgi:serine/threonine protein kinase
MFYFDYDEVTEGNRHLSSTEDSSAEDYFTSDTDDYEVAEDAYSPDEIRMEAEEIAGSVIVPIEDFVHLTTTGSSTNVTKEEKNLSDRPRVSKSDFLLHSVIGKGAYAKVFLVQKVTDPDRGAYYAMKVLKKAHIVVHQKDREHTKTERVILEEVRHPFIVRLFYAFQTDAKLYLILDYAPGGELFTYLDRQKMFLEDAAKIYMAELILALEHLHSLGIIYRDLKPENVLLDREGHVKLTDFGLSKVSVGDGGDDGARTLTVCGTVEYMAPEVLAHQPYDYCVDWWSLGAMSFDMMTGRPPFTSQNRKKTVDMIMNRKLTLPKFLTNEARDLLTRLLKKRPEARLGRAGSQSIKAHQFFASIDWKRVLERQIEVPIKPVLRGAEDVNNFSIDFTSLPVVDSPPVNQPHTQPGMTIVKGGGKDDEDFYGFSFVASCVMDRVMEKRP